MTKEPGPEGVSYSAWPPKTSVRSTIPCYQLAEDGRMVAFSELKVGDRFRVVGDPAFNPDTVRVVMKLSAGNMIVASESNQQRWARGLPGEDDDADYRDVDPKHRADVLEQTWGELGFDRKAWDQAHGCSSPQAPDRDAGSSAPQTTHGKDK